MGAAAARTRWSWPRSSRPSTREYSLAKDANFYFVFDVLGRKLELRVRGMVLRTWPLRVDKVLGRAGFLADPSSWPKDDAQGARADRHQARETEEPDARAGPGQACRDRPAAATAADFDLEALELRDMPKRFQLDFDNGLNVTVKAKDAGSRGLGGTLREPGTGTSVFP